MIAHSIMEHKCAQVVDILAAVAVYVNLPRGFAMPTPVGADNPDWAIAFTEGSVKHIYFVAATKGSLSSMDLRSLEQSKIECFFFSSRRRHTRSLRDWSSDVCSSD